MSSDVTEKPKQYSIIRIPKLDSTAVDDDLVISNDCQKTMQYSVDRLPVELPGVMGAADLDSAYGFSSYGQTAEWDVNAFIAVGDKNTKAGTELDTVCDTDAISNSDPTVFTYIFTANTFERNLPALPEGKYTLNRAWLLGATVAGPYSGDDGSNPSGAAPVSNPPTSDDGLVYSPLVGLGFGIQNTAPNDGTWGDPEYGASIKPGTCGIQKGPAMPLRAPSPYLTSPGFLPAISLPGVTAPSTTPEEREKPFDETGFSVGISFTDHYGADISKRQVCYNQYDDPQYSKICLNVSVTYKPSSDKYFPEIPAGSSFEVVLSFKDNSDSIKILDLTGKTELLNSSIKEHRIPDIKWDREGTSISWQYCMQWALNVTESDFEATKLNASVVSTIRHSKDFPVLLTNKESDTLEFECSSAPLEDMYTIEVEVKDNAEKVVSERNCCDSNDSVADSSLLNAHVRVAKTEKGKNAFIDTESVTGTLYIAPPKGVDVVLGHAPVSRPPSSTKYPLTATINLPDSAHNEEVTDIDFQYFSPEDWSCNSDSGKKDPVTISVVGCIHQGSAPENTDDCSGPKRGVDIELQCNCDDCSSKLSSLKTSMSFLEDDGTEDPKKAANPRKVCDGGTGEAPAATPWFLCKVTVDGLDNLGDACTEEMRNLVMHIEAHSDNGTLLAFGQDFEKHADISQITRSWGRTNTFKIFYEAPVTSDDADWKDVIHVNAWLTYSGEVDADAFAGEIGSSDDEMHLSCKDPSEDEDCADYIDSSLLLFEHKDGECLLDTRLTLSRTYGAEDEAKNHRQEFCVSPKITLGDAANLTGCSVQWILTLEPKRCELAVWGFDPDYSPKIRTYSGVFNVSTTSTTPEEFAFYYRPDLSKNSGSILVTFEVYKEYIDGDGKAIPRVLKDDITIKLNNEGKTTDDGGNGDDETSEICDVLDGLTVDEPLSITPCTVGGRKISVNKGCWMTEWLTIAEDSKDVLTLSTCSSDSKGMRELGISGNLINCKVLSDMASRGSGITVDCNNGGSISAKEPTCDQIIKEGRGISINNCAVSVNVDDKTIKINGEGKLEAASSQEISCSAIYEVLDAGDGISISDCTAGKIKISATGPASLPKIKEGAGIKVTENTDGSYTIALAYTVKECDK